MLNFMFFAQALEKGEIKKMKKLLCCHVFIPVCLLVHRNNKKIECAA